MHITVIGLNHKTAPVELREKLAFSHNNMGGVFKYLREIETIKETLVLSTCNRVEIYVVTPQPMEALRQVKKFLSDYHQIKEESFESNLYFYHEPFSVSHLFSVASSLDSMVVGESEVLGQVKSAYILAHQHLATGKILNVLFQRSLNAAKKVRTLTAINKGFISVSSLAVELARRIFGNLSRRPVMIIGAGEMGELTLKSLVSCGVKSIIVSNRTFEKAQELALALKARAVKFDECFEMMAHCDIVISSSAAPHYLVSKEDIKKLMVLRQQRPIFFIDISVPRNIDPEINKIDNVYLYNIDDLEKIVQENIKTRQKEIYKSQEIIEQEVKRYTAWFNREILHYPDYEKENDYYRFAGKPLSLSPK